MKQLFLLILVVFGLKVVGQGSVTITYDQDIQSMKQRFITDNKRSDEIKGWRIQIITTDDRRKMEQAISAFRNMHPDVGLKWNHVPPYYKVKVGAYQNKMQLMPFLLELKQDFRGVIPVVEQIKKTELVGIND